MISRVDIQSILKVPVNQNFSPEVMQSALQAGLPNIQDDYPDLFNQLSGYMDNLNTLIKSKADIQELGANIQSLQKKIADTESIIQKAVTNYTNQNQVVTAIIGSTGGTLPPYPTAGAELSPLSGAVNSAQETIDKLKDELARKSKEMIAASDIFKQQSETVNKSIVNCFSTIAPIDFNTNVEQFIFK